jgi:hypothetical protein
VSNPERTTRQRRRRWWIGALAVVIIAAVGGTWYLLRHDDRPTSDTAMAARAQQVMPFDLSRTTHTFTQTTDGGVERVVVNKLTDAHDRDLIRSHLQTEADNFRNGDYSDPVKIHGMDMPGVNALEQGATRINVVFTKIPGGAQITYAATEAPLISALHAWFDRQASDHGLTGMGG